MQYYLYKKCLKFKNVPKVGGGGGGVNLIGTLPQIFSIFYFDASPKEKLKKQKKNGPDFQIQIKMIRIMAKSASLGKYCFLGGRI